MKTIHKQKKILFLGGAYAQIPILKEARDRGFYIITCDYLPENPGHKYADEYFNISTTDMNGILSIAKKKKVDFVIAYASDPAAPIAAYVSEKLGLMGNSYKSVQILSEKHLFRQYLEENGYNCPSFVCITEMEDPFNKLQKLNYPFIIKPTDSSGSKGVNKVSCKEEINDAISIALNFSRNRKIIAEEYIDNHNADIHGDGFVVDGKLIFCFLGDHIYNCQSNPYNPVGTLWPSKQPFNVIKKIELDVANIIMGCGFKNGSINIEARVNSNGSHYIMEIGPRSGGHFVPQAIQYATGFDMVKSTLDIYEGNIINVPERAESFTAYYAIHSDFEGKLNRISIDSKLKPFIMEYHQYVLLGEEVKPFTGANAAIGIILMKFNKRKEMEYIIGNMKKLISILIDRN